MGDANGKASISLMDIEAYSMPSSSFVPDDAHVFCVSLDRRTEWTNKGGGWSDSRPKTRQAADKAYKEWILDFVPTSNIDKCGISFGVNGVCQTYANRELLVTQGSPCVKNAPKNFVCVVFFGKYGIGLNKLKELLDASYKNVMKSYSDPYGALPKVLQKVDTYLDDELAAWRLMSIEYIGIDVDALLRKDPVGGKNTATKRLKDLISAREELYKKYLSGSISQSTFKKDLKKIISDHSASYFQYLKSINYITSSQCDSYIQKTNALLNRFANNVEAQVQHLARNNSIRDVGFFE